MDFFAFFKPSPHFSFFFSFFFFFFFSFLLFPSPDFFKFFFIKKKIKKNKKAKLEPLGFFTLKKIRVQYMDFLAFFKPSPHFSFFFSFFFFFFFNYYALV